MEVYQLTLEGTYYASAEGRKKMVRNYTDVKVNVPSLDGSSLAMVRKLLLDKAIAKKYPDSLGGRTFYVASTDAKSPPKETKFMNRKQLEKYIAENKLDIEVADYSNVSEIRSAISLAEENPKKFATITKNRNTENKQASVIKNLNPDLDGIG